MQVVTKSGKIEVMDTNNWKEEWKRALSYGLELEPVKVRGRIFITGMGGSGIVGEVAKHITDMNIVFSKLPVEEKFDWVVAVSYSGNTMETIHTVNVMKKLGNRIIAVTSGGELEKLGDRVVKLPTGMIPRDAFPYMLSSVLAVIDAKEELKEAIRGVE
ncbi:MAG: SIS domain-containing protein, partial [Candidatus Micrarchaeota archaeon]|nr:SIS domain-containing protein [Candidatus Micrarchaeota archaeon]